ncbi:hypothetical protein J437_LFUL019674 [Ladona fulva]|uniref:DDE-1 domain-containing protein n=1 Tax=Ladona fulva TaxID=123851 RepID=A0A8K0KRX3_LADFU|nr:hypothetical protein J437_LFUL019674 [Ladona fulva]
MSQKQAADHYNINRSTIKRRLKNDLPIKPRRSTVFTSDEEMALKSFRQSIFANNIKRARAAIDETVITQYIDNLSDLTEDVPPDRIYNYDETCMSDDPGRSKIICSRGCKYPERQQSGKKIVVGDNLSPHLSLNVVKLCEKNDIKCVCLPPNYSNLTQPLDIAYFRSLRAKWRDIFTKWKQSEAGKRVASLPKDQFPMQLRTVLDEIQPSLSKNLKAGFKKAGIYPANKDEILCRLPKQDRSVKLDLVGGAFLAHVNEKRREFIKPLVKKKKIQVALGRSITAADILPQEKVTSTSCSKSKKRKKMVNSGKIQGPPKKTSRKKRSR